MVALEARAQLLQAVRLFFLERAVTEVETPLLSQAGSTDPALHSLSVATESGRRWLHTSPEFPMKRLLAEGSGDIYQIAKVFRDAEAGRYHNPEFTLLEWYRLGFDHHALMDELQALITELASIFASLTPPPSQAKHWRRLSYQEVFIQALGIDPHQASIAELADCAAQQGLTISGDLDRDAWLDALLSFVITSSWPEDTLSFIYDYPASQAALAKIDQGPPPTARRFELYWGPVELANGFHELTDPLEQRQRFEHDLEQRAAQGLAQIPMDEGLLEALQAGMPECAGVALGLDRLLMRLTGAPHIREVLSFSWDQA